MLPVETFICTSCTLHKTHLLLLPVLLLRMHLCQAVLDYLQQHPMTVSSLAMQYDAEPTTTLPDCTQGLSPADVAPSSSSEPSHMAKVIAGLLYAACGGLDQAHNLVTPLCWGSWTPYAGKMLCDIFLYRWHVRGCRCRCIRLVAICELLNATARTVSLFAWRMNGLNQGLQSTCTATARFITSPASRGL